MTMPEMPRWVDEQGGVIACTEKIKVMRENMQELYSLAQEAFEDALLMDYSEDQLRKYLIELINALENPY